MSASSIGKMAQAVQPKDEEDQIENFLSCKVRESARLPLPRGVSLLRIQDKDVKVKLRIQAEGVFYELETEAETDYVQKFVAKLLVRGCAVCPAEDH